jgi:EF-P beta-lysylation protein EpmB
MDTVTIEHMPPRIETSTTRNADVPDTPDEWAWREQLRDAVRDPDELIDLLGLPDELREGARKAARVFPLVVPRPYLARMRRGEPDDPLLRQVLPLDVERAEAKPGYVVDPVGDRLAVREAGLLQKYRGRALLITAGVCAVHCRYCFRRHFPYEESTARLERSPELEEVILSGGDPLMRSDAWLGELVAGLEKIPHVRRLRVHTRLPIVIPGRVDSLLLGWLGKTRLAPTVVVHTNHPNEIDATCGDALLRLVTAGVPVLNQTVLLRGVNDDAATLVELSRRLLDVRVMPYYLHQLDPVIGAAHFEVPVERGLELVGEMRTRLPGFGVPRYVREVEGAAHKIELAL